MLRTFSNNASALTLDFSQQYWGLESCQSINGKTVTQILTKQLRFVKLKVMHILIT